MPKRRPWWPPLLIIGTACVFCWPVFVGRIMLPADMVLLFLPWKNALASEFPNFRMPHNPMLDPIQQYLPWRIYAVESLRSGVVPLWNPYSFMGTAFLANLQSAVLYPPNLIFLVAGAGHGFGVSAILHLVAGGLLMYAFLRTLGLHRAAATLGAVVSMLNGFTVAWLEYPTLSLWTLMWLPGILLTYERAVRRPASVWPVLCAGMLVLALLGGHLQIAAYLVMAFLIYAVARAVARRRESPPIVGIALALGSLLIALALAAGQLLPTLELASHSGRVSHGLAGALRTRFPLTHLVLYLVPNFFGNPADPGAPYWGNLQDPSAINFFETACYAGILPLVLAVWGLRRWREMRCWYFAALIAFAVLSATGPLYPVLYYLAPGFKELAGLGRILCLAAFGIAGLAAVGADELLARTQATGLGRSIPILFVFGALLIVAAWVLFGAAIAELGASFLGYLAVRCAVCVVLALAATALIWARARLRLSASAFAVAATALVLLDLFGFGVSFNPYVSGRLAYPETEAIRWLKEHIGHDRMTSLAPAEGGRPLDWMPHNAPMVFGLRDIHGSDSLRVKRSFALVSPSDGNQSRYPPPGSPLLKALGVRYLATTRPLGGGWRLAADGEVPVYEQTDAAPRAWMTEWVQVVDDQTVLNALRGVGSPPWAGVPDAEVAAALAPKPGASAPRSTAEGARVNFERDDRNAVTLRVKSGGDAVLVVNDSYYPGWRAWVDGKPTPIHRVNYGFRGIAVPAGTHTVAMRYEPGSYRVGLFASLIALAALSAAATTRYARKGAGRPRPFGFAQGGPTATSASAA